MPLWLSLKLEGVGVLAVAEAKCLAQVRLEVLYLLDSGNNALVECLLVGLALFRQLHLLRRCLVLGKVRRLGGLGEGLEVAIVKLGRVHTADVHLLQ